MQNFFYPDFYVSRSQEIKDISERLQKNNALIIVGDTGIGKTVLSKQYALENPLNFLRINYYKGRDFNYNRPNFDGTYLPVLNSNPTLTIIDGLDEIQAEYRRYEIIDESLMSIKYGHKLLIKLV
jgi:predicted NACHT family NTPase